jgi:hypothetical protein
MLLAVRYWVWFPEWENDFIFFKTYRNFRWPTPASHSIGTPGLFRPVCEVDYKASFSTKVKNEWSYASVSALRPIGVHRDDIFLHIFMLCEYELATCLADMARFL